MNERYYKFLFQCATGDTECECTLPRAIEIARNKVLDGYSRKVVLKVFNPRKSRWVKLGDYCKAADPKPYKPTQEVPDPPEVVDVSPVLHKIPREEYWNAAAWDIKKG